ncbi:MAG: hypothetical protein EXR92_01250 [Gemmatimonadetes bacterium]|nr:hypothetical protein [Gemmatimonadota bacterium]
MSSSRPSSREITRSIFFASFSSDLKYDRIKNDRPHGAPLTFSILPPAALRAASAATLFLLLSAAGCGGEDDELEAAAEEIPAASTQPVLSEQGLQQFDLSAIGYNEGTEETAAFGVIEFADFGCIHCFDFHESTYPALHTEFIASGDLLWKYIPVTLAGFPNGDLAAVSAMCAAGSDKFGPMRDYLFGKREEWLVSTRAEALFVEYAAAVGLNAAQFRACLTGPDTHAKLEENNRIARQIGVTGTPTFIVAGTPVEGAPPLESFQTALRQMIAASRSAAQASPTPPARPGP